MIGKRSKKLNYMELIGEINQFVHTFVMIGHDRYVDQYVTFPKWNDEYRWTDRMIDDGENFRSQCQDPFGRHWWMNCCDSSLPTMNADVYNGMMCSHVNGQVPNKDGMVTNNQTRFCVCYPFDTVRWWQKCWGWCIMHRLYYHLLAWCDETPSGIGLRMFAYYQQLDPQFHSRMHTLTLGRDRPSIDKVTAY